MRRYKWINPRGFALFAYITLWAQVATRLLEALLLSVVLFAGEAHPNVLAVFVPLDAVMILAYVVGVVACGAWTWRVNANAQTFGRGLDHGPWGAILWYICPIANLFIPYQAMSEIWDASQGASGERREGQLVGWWWGAFIAGNILASITRIVATPGGPFAIEVTILTMLALAASAFLFIRVVRGVTRYQVMRKDMSIFSEAARPDSDIVAQPSTSV